MDIPEFKIQEKTTADPFAWPFSDVNPENYHYKSHYGPIFPDSSVNYNSTEKPMNTNASNVQILDDLFKSFSGHDNKTTVTTNPTYNPATEMMSTFDSTLSTENNTFTDKQVIVIERTTESYFDEATKHFVGIVKETTTEKPIFFSTIKNVANEIKSTIATITEAPLFNNTTLTDTETERTFFDLDTAINISSVEFPVRANKHITSVTDNIKDLINSMHTTIIDPSIIEPIHNPVTYHHNEESKTLGFIMHVSNTEPPLFSDSSTIESPINLNMSINSTVNTTFDDLFHSTTQSINTTMLEQAENVTRVITNEITTVTNNITTAINKTTALPTDTTTAVNENTSVLYNVTTAVREITNNITHTVSELVSEITTEASKVINEVSKVTNVDYEETNEASTMPNEASTVTSGASTVTNEITTSVNDMIDSISNKFKTATSEIINVAENVTSTPKVHNILRNATREVHSEQDEPNKWVFYVILVGTVLILLIVIGGVFLFYKKIKGGKESGYQVSQMRDYSSSNMSESDAGNAKV